MVNLLASLEKIKEAEILALIVFAIRSNSRRDEELKIGKTKMKSVMVYFLVRAGISYNHLGNNDCMKLSAQPIIPKAASSPAVMYFEPSEHTNRLHSSRQAQTRILRH
uniref:Myo-inositol-1-phosphate synthase n=1 Tax=Citrus limon TaxID=2708 RepID=A0A1S8ADA6_CITLI